MAETVKKKGSERKIEILQTATEILAQEGPGGLTLRAVAGRVGISLAAVQYYFPTHSDLIQAMADAVIAAFANDIAEAMQNDDPKARLRGVIDKFLTADGPTDQNIFRLTIHFWSLAHADPDGQEIFERFTAQYLSDVEHAIHQARPELSSRQVADRALALTSLFEGTNVMALVRLPRSELQKYDEGLVKAALAIIYSD